MSGLNVLLLIVITLLRVSLAHANAIPGKPAPAFRMKDASGVFRTLDDTKGKWLVLEWTDRDCPFVKKHYESANMQTLQKTYTAKNVVWYSVISATKGKFSSADTLRFADEYKSRATAILMDDSGEMGKAYGAIAAPHMFVIDPNGTVVYAGAIDSIDSFNPNRIPGAVNFVEAALDAGIAGKKVQIPSARVYGCSIKY